MATAEISPFYQELIDSDDFIEIEVDYAEKTGSLGNSFIKVLSEEQPRFSRWMSYTDPKEYGFSVPERKRRIKQFAEGQEGRRYNTPEVIDTSIDNVVEVEYLNNAVSFTEYLLSEDREDVRSVSQEIGASLRDMHDNGWAFRDFNYGNIMVEDSGFDEAPVVYFVDSEMSKKNPTPQDKFFDKTVFIHTYGILEDAAEPVLEGFQRGYGATDLDMKAHAVFAAAKYVLFDRDIYDARQVIAQVM